MNEFSAVAPPGERHWPGPSRHHFDDDHYVGAPISSFSCPGHTETVIILCLVTARYTEGYGIDLNWFCTFCSIPTISGNFVCFLIDLGLPWTEENHSMDIESNHYLSII